MVLTDSKSVLAVAKHFTALFGILSSLAIPTAAFAQSPATPPNNSFLARGAISAIGLPELNNQKETVQTLTIRPSLKGLGKKPYSVIICLQDCAAPFKATSILGNPIAVGSEVQVGGLNVRSRRTLNAAQIATVTDGIEITGEIKKIGKLKSNRSGKVYQELQIWQQLPEKSKQLKIEICTAHCEDDLVSSGIDNSILVPGNKVNFIVSQTKNGKVRVLGAALASITTLPTPTSTPLSSFSINSFEIQPDCAMSPLGIASIAAGSSKTFTAGVRPGYLLSEVLVDLTSVGAVPSYTFSNVHADHTITCKAVLAFTPTPTPTPVPPSATFSIRSVEGQTDCTMSPLGLSSVTAGASKTFTASVRSGFELKDVIVDSISIGAVPSYTFSNVQADHSITCRAVLAPTPTPTPTPNVPFSINSFESQSDCTMSPLGVTRVAAGGSKTFTASVRPGYRLSEVLVDSANVGPKTSYGFFNVQANHSITCRAVLVTTPTPTPTPIPPSETYTIRSFEAQTHDCTMSPLGFTTVTAGGSKTFTASLRPGYELSDVIVDFTRIGAVASYTFSNVLADHSITCQGKLISPATPTPTPTPQL